MSSIKQLRRQNLKLRNQLKSKVELHNLEEERIRLGEQNKRLLKQLRRSPSSKATLRTLRNIGKGALIVGKSLGKGLIAYGRFLNKAEKRNRRQARSLKRRR